MLLIFINLHCVSSYCYQTPTQSKQTENLNNISNIFMLCVYTVQRKILWRYLMRISPQTKWKKKKKNVTFNTKVGIKEEKHSISRCCGCCYSSIFIFKKKLYVPLYEILKIFLRFFIRSRCPSCCSFDCRRIFHFFFFSMIDSHDSLVRVDHCSLATVHDGIRIVCATRQI